MLDMWGLEVTGDLNDLQLHKEVLDGYFLFSPNMTETLDKVSMSEMPMTHILKAQLLLMATTQTGHAAATEVAERLDIYTLNDRERQHLAALKFNLKGDSRSQCRIFSSILRSYPSDMMAIRLQHFELFNLGLIDEMLEAVQTALLKYSDDLPYVSLLGGMQCFALEELGRFDEAIEPGIRAAEANPRDLWSVHSVAHVNEMTNNFEEGIRWVHKFERSLREAGSFAGHIWWHLALFHIRQGDTSGALKLYDDYVFDVNSVEGLTMSNAISLLARLDFLGVNVGERWQRLVPGSVFRIGHHTKPFNDCHYAYALAKAGATGALNDLLSSMRDASDMKTHAGKLLQEVGVPVAAGLASLAKGNYGTSFGELEPVWSKIWMLGGSNAQRDFFDQSIMRSLNGLAKN
jgi:tetratricopeptide (TPR) repeat protein